MDNNIINKLRKELKVKPNTNKNKKKEIVYIQLPNLKKPKNID